MQINYAKKEVSCKLVYYGPGMSGKTTNLEVIHQKVPDDNKGEMTSIATEGDRTLFFDFLPLDLGKVRGMTTKFQLYTVPGQVYYASTRKLVLQGADGVIFVADSQEDKLAENKESLQDLVDNLAENGYKIEELALVIQWNKRDLPSAMAIEDLEKEVNIYGATTTEAIAATGEGVLPTLKLAASMVLDRLNAAAPDAAAAPPKAAPKPAEKEERKTEVYVARVNKDQISKGYFNQYCQVQYRLTAKSDSVEDFKKFSEEEKKKLLESLINYVLLLQDAKKHGITAAKDEIEAQVNSFAKKFGSKDKLEEYLKERKLSLDNLRNEATRNIIINNLIQNVIPDLADRMVVNDDDVQKYYEHKKKKFGGKPLEEVKQAVAAGVKNARKRGILDDFYKKLREQASIDMFLDDI